MTLKQVIVVRTDLKMGKGKIAAQCAHASIEAFLKTKQKDDFAAEQWLKQGMPKIVVRADSEKEILDLFEKAKKTMPCALIKDAGRTQIQAGSITALAIGPWPEQEIDNLTKSLKLL